MLFLNPESRAVKAVEGNAYKKYNSSSRIIVMITPFPVEQKPSGYSYIIKFRCHTL
jgi:hypothetical protein